MKDFKEWVPYLAGVASILFGVGLLWAPPPSLAADPGAVGIALSFITGGFAALGVTVGASKLKKAAYDQGLAEGQLLALGHSGGPDTGPGHPDVGHGHIHLQVKNNAQVVEGALRARKWADDNLVFADERFTVVNAMEDPFNAASGNERPKGGLVIVEVLLLNTARHSEPAHLRMKVIANKVESDCPDYFQNNKVQHWCCWSDH